MAGTRRAARSDVGRPRSGVPDRPDLSASEQILDAAGRLFVERGYSATTTRAIADAVGIRQASLYYHFATKERLLDVLLLRTVQPSMTMAARLADADGPAAVRLFALIAYDAGQLATAPHNVGTLYLLPEARAAQFGRFHEERQGLRAVYAALIARTLDERADARAVPDGDRTAAVVFGLVESIIAIRADHPEEDPGALVALVARSALRVLGFGDRELEAVAVSGHDLLEALEQSGPGVTPA
ncbi:TetR/AcrR family transcriptional regulator [Herbiconiux sp. 11R-BC]|uniref:TetR/AcrR family transcriptional regulator n=1 Tax=Herbiconiux sp. 11R-BC TaxID=3111637 RepID=UPI003C0C2E16